MGKTRTLSDPTNNPAIQAPIKRYRCGIKKWSALKTDYDYDVSVHCLTGRQTAHESPGPWRQASTLPAAALITTRKQDVLAL